MYRMEITSMIIELAMAGMLECTLVTQKIKDDDLYCFYQCVDTTREFASTSKQYFCPKTLYEDRMPLPFRDRNHKKNKWTDEDIDKILKD